MSVVVLAVLASVGAGLAAHRRDPGRARAGSDAVLTALLWVALPFVTFFTLARLEVTPGVGAGLVLAAAELALVGLAAWLVATRLLGLARPTTGALVVVCVLANTGYLGIPLNATLLGRDAVAPAIAWDTLVSGPSFYLAGFAIGATFGTAGGATVRARLRTFLLRNPPLAAVLAALVAPDALAPEALVEVAAAVAVFAVLPLAFFALGVNLAAEPVTRRVDRALGAAIGLRLLAAPAIYLALTALLVDVPDAYRLQSAMPSAINSLVVAHACGLDVRLTAAAVAWTTALAVAVALVAGTVV